ncbi:PWWP domain-containing protein [Lachancea thermotolerans]
MEQKLTTGDLVLCKVGSFAPWPAVVFPQRLLRKDVYRRRRAECVAVCFFNDETYYWDKPARLKRLTKSTIERFLEDAPATEDPGLVGAYEEARDYTSLHEFVMQRLEEENRMEEWEKSAEADTKVEAGQDPFEGRPAGLKAGGAKLRKSSASASPPRGYPKARRAASGSADGSIGTKSSSASLKSRSVPESPSAVKKLSRLDHAKRVEISLLFRCKLQRNLVQRELPPGPDEIKESHKLLGKITENTLANPQFFDFEALKHSKLHKLLKVITNDDNLAEFHRECNDILASWSPVIAELKKDKLNQRRDT